MQHVGVGLRMGKTSTRPARKRGAPKAVSARTVPPSPEKPDPPPEQIAEQPITVELAPSPEEERDLSSYLSFARGFWRGDDRRTAWVLTAGVGLFIVLNLVVQVGINRWNA